VIQMESGKDNWRAIEGNVVAICSGAGVVIGGAVIHLDVEKGVDGNHFRAHVVCRPLKDLGADVDKECVRGPAAEDHNFCSRDVIDEQSHGCTRAN
jgi:hypothetical protein